VKRILVTGFKPFLGESINPSALILRELKNSDAEVETLLLPVSFENAFATLQNHWDSHGPYEGLLMLGQAGERSAICLERVAINWLEASSPDEDGVLPPVGPVMESAPSAYISDFFPGAWAEALNKLGPVQVSHSAGAYVCNALYFQTLHHFPQDVAALFTHVPYLPEQTHSKPAGTPSMELATQVKIIQALIRLMKAV